MLTESLIDHYLTEFKQRKGYTPKRPARGVTADLRIAEALIAWCADRQVDPCAVVSERFSVLWFARGVCPQFNALRSDGVVHAARVREASTCAARTLTDPFRQAVRDLLCVVPGQDQVRRRYLLEGKPGLCESNPHSGGYDSRSAYCRACPNAVPCAQALRDKWGFDVPALRAGNLAGLPPVVIKALRGNADGSVPV